MKLSDFAKKAPEAEPESSGKLKAAKPSKLLAALTPPKEEAEETDAAPSKEEVAVAKELQSAFTKGSPAALAMALKNFLHECGVYK